MWSTGFAEKVALERDMLTRAMPLVPSDPGGIRITLHQPGQRAGVSVHAPAAVCGGATPGRCIEMLGIRPLLFGAAWKIMDAVIETAFEIGHVPLTAATTTPSRRSHETRLLPPRI